MKKSHSILLMCLAIMLSTQSMANTPNIVSDDNENGVKTICAVAGIMAKEAMLDALNGVDKTESQKRLTKKYLVAAESGGARHFIQNAVEINTRYAYSVLRERSKVADVLPKSEYEYFARDFGKVQFQQCMKDATSRQSQ